MIISSKQVQNILKVYGENKVTKSVNTDKASQVQRRDEVVLSSAAKEFGPMLQALKNMPDVREDKVKEISEKIQSGNYTIDGRKVADKMIGRIMADRLR